MKSSLLSVRGLSVRFESEEGHIDALDHVSFEVPSRSTVAMVGESGSGKSVTALSIMRLLQVPPARIIGGSILLDGEDLLSASERRMRAIRGERIGIVFQDPLAALNPVYPVGAQVAEALRIHRRAGWRDARQKAIELLRGVGFPQPESRHADYPHELSGGMRQRVMIAIALACEPQLLIADEPTTALDMLAAAQINALLADLKRERDMSLLLISHDVAAVAENADHIVVMYAGQVVEHGPAHMVLTAPRHPYTRGLLRSVPPLRARRRRRHVTPTRLPVVGAMMANGEGGCRFANRCSEVHDRCREAEPELLDAGEGGWARCFLVDEGVVLPLTRAIVSETAPVEEEAPDSAEDEELEQALDQDSVRVEPTKSSAKSSRKEPKA